MPSLKDYFEKNRQKAKFHIGDRVITKTTKQKGTVMNDSIVNYDVGPIVSIWLDKPDGNTEIISVKQEEVKILK